MTGEAPPGGEIALGARSRNKRRSARAARPWLVVQQWIAANTFAPTWLPRRWQRPVVGYLLAVLAEMLAVGATAGLVQVFPTFEYRGIVSLLAIASVALAWGAAPSLAATAVGAVLLDFLVLPPRFVWHFHGVDDMVEEGLFVVCGVVIAASASRTERARRTAQGLADAVVDAMADGIYVCDRAGRIQKTNGALRRLLALDDQAAYSSRRHDQAALFLPRDSEGRPLPHEKWPVVRVLKGETLTGAHAVDMYIRTRDGRELELNTSGAPVRDADGRLTGGVLVARDVTERRRLERRTHQALSGLLAMAEALVLGPPEATGVDAHTPAATTRVARHVAELTCSVLGCERVGIVAVDEATDVVHPVAAAGLPPVQEQQWRKELEQTPLHEYLGNPELLAQRQTDEVVLLDETHLPQHALPHPSTARSYLVAPLRVGTQLIGVLTVDHGGDAERAYTSVDRALVGAAAKIVALVLERERLLREHAEAQAQEWALREANQRMDEFVSLAAHELKTPVAAIQGFVELAHREVQRALSQDSMMAREVAARGGAANNMLERAEQYVKHLTRLMNDLLDISRIQSGLLEMRWDTCDLAEIVRACVDTQRLVWPGRTITLDEPAEAVHIRADADRIGQVVTNYMTNALKYSAADQPVAVSLRREGTEAYVLMRDQGPGLTVEQQTHIWDRYRRVQGLAVQDNMRGAGGGLGLGLYISRTIIEQHSGRVGVESRPGAGSTFWFALPLSQ